MRSFWQRMFGEPPRVGLALSGGGARGLAHIGVLKVLEREGIPVHFLSGASMGGLIAALYAAGFSAQELEEEALRLTRPRQLVALLDRALPRRGLLVGQKVLDQLERWLGDRTFEQLQVPLALTAVDLNGGKKVVLREGRVRDAVRATISLPGLLAPVERGDQLLIDGGALDNLPTDVVRQMGAEVVIAVDVATDMQAVFALTEGVRSTPLIPGAIADLLDVLGRSLAVVMGEINRRNLELAPPDLLIRPAIPRGVTVLTGLTRAAETIAAGEQAATEALPRIGELMR